MTAPPCTTCLHSIYNHGLECHHPQMLDPYDGKAHLASIERKSGRHPCGPLGELWEPTPPFWTNQRRSAFALIVVLAALIAVLTLN